MAAEVLRISDLLSDLAGRDIKLWVDGDQLRCSAPAGALTPEFRTQLRNRKGEIIGFLNMATAATRQQPAIVPLQARGARTPIYAVPGHVGAPFSFADLSKHLGDDQPFYALQPPGFDGQSEPLDRVEEVAEYFANQMLEHQPTGPYVVAGYCSGAATALELALILGRRGAEVRCLVLFGPLHPVTYKMPPRLVYFYAKRRADPTIRRLAKLPSFGARLRYCGSRLRSPVARIKSLLSELRESKEAIRTDPVLASRERLKSSAIRALRHYRPTRYDGAVRIFLPNKAWVKSGSAPLRWLQVVPQAEIYYGPSDCDGPRMLEDPDAAAFAELYREAMRQPSRQNLISSGERSS